MKKFLSTIIAFLFATVIFACDAPDGYTRRQSVTTYVVNDYGQTPCKRSNVEVFQANNACDAFCACHDGRIFYVSRSNRSGYKYMYWDQN